MLLALGCKRRSGKNAGATAARPRVVSLSPNTTEALFAVGAGNLVVGRSRFCDYPPGVEQIPSVGGYVDASLEAILALAPDWVVGARGPAGPALAEKLGALGIATFFPPTESMAEIDAMITGLADKVGQAERGREIVLQLGRDRRAIEASVAEKPRVRTLMVFSISPIVAAGPSSFCDEMIRLANGSNVVTSGGSYPTVSVERLVTMNPDVVLNATMTAENADDVGPDRPGFAELRAVREGRVVPLKSDAVLRPGPRIAEGLRIVARALHPTVQVP